MKTFGHTVREGAVIGFVYAYSCAFVILLALALSADYGYAPTPFPFLEFVVVIFPPWGFLAVLAGYSHASRYSVTVDDNFITLWKNGEEIERRTTHKVLRLYRAYQQPKSRIEFSDEPALVIPWMSPGKLRQIRSHVFRLSEASYRQPATRNIGGGENAPARASGSLAASSCADIFG